MDAAFDSSTFKSNSQSSARSFFDLGRLLLGAAVARDEDSPDAWDQLLRKIEPVLEEVSDDNRFCACCSCRKQRDETDGARTAINMFEISCTPNEQCLPDKKRVSKTQSRALDAGQCHCQRFTE